MPPKLNKMILVDADRLAVARPGKQLFEDLSFTVSEGDRLGVVGLNGGGKSTLLRVLAGRAEPEAGLVRRGRNVRIAMLDQNPVLGDGTVRQAVDGAVEGDWEADAVLDRLGMGTFVDVDTATLSGGQAKRVALARTLVAQCDLLILDEPTNHLDIDAIAWLEDRLAMFRGGLILVTHDRHVLDRVTNKVLELDRGRGYMHDGGYDAYLEGKADREELAAKTEASRRILARTELAWLRRGAPARTRKSKSRVASATKIVEGRAEKAARPVALDLASSTPGGRGPGGGQRGDGRGGDGRGSRGGEGPAAVGSKDGRGWGEAAIEKRYPGVPRLGNKVVELHRVGHRYDDSRASGEVPWLFEQVDLLLDNRERLGIVGPNGGGKSTLLDIIAGRTRPAAGTVERGPTVRLGYYDQVGATLDLKQRVREAIAGPNRQPDWTDAALLEQFWFDTDAQWAPIELLSGGERRRLQLLLVLAAKPNVLLLDEPTNDLDLDTLRVLEDFLEDWPGALMVVSHDRAFLERTVTDVMVVDGRGAAGRRAGGYAAWEDERRASRGRGRTQRFAGDVAGSASALPAAKTPARASEKASEKAPAKASESASEKARTPSTLRHLLKDTDKQLAKAVKLRARLEATLVSAAAQGDHEALARLGAELAAATASHEALEEKWLELSDELDR